MFATLLLATTGAYLLCLPLRVVCACSHLCTCQVQKGLAQTCSSGVKTKTANRRVAFWIVE